MKIFTFVMIVVLIMALTVIPCFATAEDENGESSESEEEYYETFDEEATLLAKLLYRECRGVASTTQKAAVAWVVFNRVDDPEYPDTVREVILQRNQFASVRRAKVIPELYELAKDVLIRYRWEKLGFIHVGRVIPADYLWFAGKNGKNTFRSSFSDSVKWDFSLASPYDS